MKDGKMLMLAVVVTVMIAGSAMASELTVTIQGTGDGIVIGDEIYCEPDCTRTYPDESIVHLKAVPDDWSEFKGWLVDGEPQEGSIVIRKDITVTAIFEKIPVPEFEVVGTQPFHLDSPLFDSGNAIVGSLQTVIENGFREHVVTLLDGTSFRLYPLQMVVASKNRNRIIAAGYAIGTTTPGQATRYVGIYSMTGELIKLLNPGIAGEFVICIEDNGGFWLAGKDIEPKDSFRLRRYSPDGELIWERPLPAFNFGQITLSLDEQYASVVLEESMTRDLPSVQLYPPDGGQRRKDVIMTSHRDSVTKIQYYTPDGTLVYEQEPSKYFYGVEFISEQKVVVYDADEWEIYRLGDFATSIASGRFKGNPGLGSPIVAFPQQDCFLLITLFGSDFPVTVHMQAVHNETGEVLAESVFENQEVFIARINEQGVIELVIDGIMLELKIP